MTDVTGMHAPTPEFRAALEEEVVRALHREERPAPSTRFGRIARWPVAAALVIGLVLGVGSGFASAQVRGAQQKDELTSALEPKRLLAVARLELAQVALEEARKKVAAGTSPRSALASAEADVRIAEANVARIDLDLAEIRVTATPPRDELWAPLVGGRDFVKERLAVDATILEQRDFYSQVTLLEAERGRLVGTVSDIALDEARMEQAQQGRARNLLAQKIALRKQCLEEHLTPEDVARRVERLEITNALQRLQEQLDIANKRVVVVKKGYTLGTGVTELDVKRAEVEALSRTVELAKLRLQLQLLDKAGGRGGN